MAKVVTLLTDFGSEDTYVAEVKAVLLSAGSAVKVIDITHAIPPFDVNRGAFQLFRSYGYFPKGTIHVAVVDPGVGTKRRSVYVKTKNYHFIGPDNGLLSWAVDDCERRDGKKASYFEIVPDAELLPTFHGRDLFAPFAVGLIKSKRLRTKKIEHIEGDGFPVCRELDGIQRGKVISQDHFGNIITNIPWSEEDREAELQINHRSEKLRSVDNYLSIEKGKFAILRGSHGFWEIACAQNSAWDHLKVDIGDDLTLFPAGWEGQIPSHDAP